MKYIKFYKPTWPRNVAYMLQSVEYDTKEYLGWLWFDIKNGGLPNKIDFTFKKTRITKIIIYLTHIFVALFLLLAAALLAINFEVFLILALIIGLLSPFLAAISIAAAIYMFGARKKLQQDTKYLKNIEEKIGKSSATKIAISGSYGKSSMRDIIFSVVSESKKVATPEKNYNTPAGISSFANSLQGDEEVLIIELGEYYPGDVAKLASAVKPDIGIVTGANEMHLSKMGSMEKTVATVMELADFVEPDRLLINRDNNLLINHVYDKNVSYGVDGVGEWNSGGFKSGLHGTTFTLSRGKTKFNVRSSLLGEHQVGPLSAATFVGSSLGMTKTDIESGLSKTKPFPRRFEYLQRPSGVRLIDDSYNGNIDGVIAAINYIDNLKNKDFKGKTIYFTAGLIEQGKEAENIHKKIGKKLAMSKIDAVYLADNRLSRIIGEELEKSKKQCSYVELQRNFVEDVENFAVAGDLVFVQNSQVEDYFYS